MQIARHYARIATAAKPIFEDHAMTAAKHKRNPQKISKPRVVRLKPSSYQPSAAELREEIDMPKLTLKQARAAFARPFRFLREKVE